MFYFLLTQGFHYMMLHKPIISTECVYLGQYTFTSMVLDSVVIQKSHRIAYMIYL